MYVAHVAHVPAVVVLLLELLGHLHTVRGQRHVNEAALFLGVSGSSFSGCATMKSAPMKVIPKTSLGLGKSHWQLSTCSELPSALSQVPKSCTNCRGKISSSRGQCFKIWSCHPDIKSSHICLQASKHVDGWTFTLMKSAPRSFIWWLLFRFSVPVGFDAKTLLNIQISSCILKYMNTVVPDKLSRLDTFK